MGRCLAQAVTQLVGREGLGQKVVGAELGRLDGRLEGGVRGDEEGQRLAALVADLLQHLEAVDARQLEVEQQDVERGAVGKRRQEGLARLEVGELVGDVDLHVGQVEGVAVDDALHAQAERLLVVDHDHLERLLVGHRVPLAQALLRCPSLQLVARAA